MYYADGAVNTWKGMQEFVADAKAGKKVKEILKNTGKSCIVPENSKA